MNKVRYHPEDNSYTLNEKRENLFGPLNVGFQITRRCNLRCSYCSESLPLNELGLNELNYAFDNLRDAGVVKINLTGGEALLRKDLNSIVLNAMDRGFHIAIDSNATLVTEEIADFLSGKLSYFESTIDGTPEQHNKVRGKYEEVLSGIKKISQRDIPLYITMVLLGNNIDGAKHVIQTARELGARQVKFLTPIPKARGMSLPDYYIFNDNLGDIWENLLEFRDLNKLDISISLADWRKIGRGSVILVNSDGNMVGSPSIGETGCVTPMGNLLEHSVRDLWKDYPHKDNHYKKYFGETMLHTLTNSKKYQMK